MTDTDRSTKQDRTLMQFEDTLGVMPSSGPPNLRLPSLYVEIQPEMQQKATRTRGSDFAVAQMHGIESSTFVIPEFAFTFEEWNYILEGFFGHVTAVETSTGSGAWKREYMLQKLYRSLAIHSGDPLTRIEQILAAVFTGLSLKDGANDIMIGANGIGRLVSSGEEDDVEPADEGDIQRVAVVPGNPVTTGLYLSDTYSGLGLPGASTPDPSDDFAGFEAALGNWREAVTNKKPTAVSWDKVLESEGGTGTAKIILAFKALAWSFVNKLRNNQIFFARDEITGPVIPGSGRVQVETATAAGSVSGDGNASVVVTGAHLTGSPITIPVAVLNGDTASAWAAKVRTALAANSVINGAYIVGGTGTSISLTDRTRRANDGTLNIALATGTATGITAAPTSANTTSGIAPVNYLCATDIAAALSKHVNLSKEGARDIANIDLDLMETEDLNGIKITTITGTPNLVDPSATTPEA
jgi:hypothetical protein